MIQDPASRQNRRWILVRRPDGPVEDSCFDPTQRGWMNAGDNYVHQFPQAFERLRELVDAGRLVLRKDIADGLERALAALRGLFEGRNHGKQLVRVAPECEMATGERGRLLWQFELTWSLFEYHLDRLTPEDILWEPTACCWTVRPGPGGAWVPDWADAEPDPVPVPTIGWVTWHLGWWWTTALHHLQGRTPPDRTAIQWPGDRDTTIAWLRALHDEWSTAVERLTDAELDAEARFPWPEGSGLTVMHMLGWVNAELMKNVAEIGQLRLLRHAGDTGRRQASMWTSQSDGGVNT